MSSSFVNPYAADIRTHLMNLPITTPETFRSSEVLVRLRNDSKIGSVVRDTELSWVGLATDGGYSAASATYIFEDGSSVYMDLGGYKSVTTGAKLLTRPLTTREAELLGFRTWKKHRDEFDRGTLMRIDPNGTAKEIFSDEYDFDENAPGAYYFHEKDSTAKMIRDIRDGKEKEKRRQEEYDSFMERHFPSITSNEIPGIGSQRSADTIPTGDILLDTSRQEYSPDENEAQPETPSATNSTKGRSSIGLKSWIQSFTFLRNVDRWWS